MLKYADDIMLISKVSKDCSESPICAELLNAQSWISSNKMVIRRDKCKQMFFKLSNIHDVSRYAIPNIPVTSKLTFLGVTFDERLKWKGHVNEVTRKAASKLSVIRQLKPFLGESDLVIIFNSCIRSVLEYAAPLFVNLQIKQQDLIERIQQRAHKIICGDSDCDCANFIPLNYRRLMLGMRFFKSLVYDESHPLHYLTYRTPMVKNKQRATSFIVTMTQLANDGF